MSGDNVMNELPPKKLMATVGSGVTKFRNFVINTFFVLVLLLLIVGGLSNCQTQSVPEGSALIVNPTGTIVERSSLPQSLMQVFENSRAPSETEIGPLLEAIDRAATDVRIKLLVLDLDLLVGMSAAHANGLGDALERFSESGKKVISYGDFYAQSQYHLASFADAVYMHPYGQILLTGYGGSSFFIKDLLDKVGVNVHVFRVGEYKSAVEPYTRNDMSEESRMATEQLYSDLWQHFIADVARNRELAEHEVQSYADNILEIVQASNGDLARAALESQLVDELMTPDQAIARIAQDVGYADTNSEEFNGIDYATYLSLLEPSDEATPPYIDIITVQGAITLEGDSLATANANVIVELIRRSRRNEETAAIVVRVDSPGGSQFASELIRQELELAQLGGTPVVASFGSAAASGGYWLSATADEIVSEATTITGSIGIFSVVTTYEKTLSDLGVHTDGVGTTANTTGLSTLVGINEAMSGVLQARVEHGYDQFVNLVAKGRSMEKEQVLGLAGGRVWSGEAALDLGLVDQLGGLNEALRRAAELAGVTSWQKRHVDPSRDPRSELIAELLSAQALVKGPIMRALPIVTDLSKALVRLQWLDDPGGLHVMCMECVTPSHESGSLILRQ
ncbi:MAG: protease-4 [Candidatus Azotimanducaceae bacterium]|jgi:protease-4